MSALSEFPIEYVHHYTPLHYLPFIARDQRLRTKPSLRQAGFDETHFRTKSHKQDIARGFEHHAFLTLDPSPRILKAKLAAGFPHIAIAIPASEVEKIPHSLCRFNVAMTRNLRRGNKSGFFPSSTNGQYYDEKQIPIARTTEEKRDLLNTHLGKNMIEILIDEDLPLPSSTRIYCFCDEDTSIAGQILQKCSTKWSLESVPPPGDYPFIQVYHELVHEFIEKAMAHPTWRGSGLEFDRI